MDEKKKPTWEQPPLFPLGEPQPAKEQPRFYVSCVWNGEHRVFSGQGAYHYKHQLPRAIDALPRLFITIKQAEECMISIATWVKRENHQRQQTNTPLIDLDQIQVNVWRADGEKVYRDWQKQLREKSEQS